MPQCSSPCSDAVLYCEANSKGQLFLIADIHSFHFTLRFSCMAISFAFSASSSVFIEVLVLIPYTSTIFTVASKQLQDKLYSLKKKKLCNCCHCFYIATVLNKLNMASSAHQMCGRT
ncbi:hypothetical protein MRX96_039227 [Rhipicephalus microplus]